MDPAPSPACPSPANLSQAGPDCPLAVNNHAAPAQVRKAEATVVIRNRLGLHARPAMSFVDIANSFASTIRVRKGDQEVDGKSIMQMMMLAATQGTELHITAEGQDAEQALAALVALIDRNFDEE